MAVCVENKTWLARKDLQLRSVLAEKTVIWLSSREGDGLQQKASHNIFCSFPVVIVLDTEAR